MNLRTEISLDIDNSKRKLWLTTIAEGVEEDQVETVVEAMANAMLTQAVEAHNLVRPSMGSSNGDAPMPRTFQDDN